MAEPVPLDPRSYSGTYKAIAGFLAGDFANTISYPETDRPHDWLDPHGNIATWMDELDVTGPVDDGNNLIAFRDAIREVALAAIDRRAPDPEALEAMSQVLQAQRRCESLTWDRARAHPTWTADHRPPLEAQVARSLLAVLLDDRRRARLGACDECRWVFIDETRNRSRRWCDPADCGNRARQRRYANRHGT